MFCTNGEGPGIAASNLNLLKKKIASLHSVFFYSGVVIDDLQMAQFHMARYDQGVTNNKTMRLIESGFRNDSVAFLHFYFERQTGFFLLQIYTPLLVIVMCSWVAFWIVKTDAPARCGLGITTVLSVTKIGFGGKGKPQVGYPTALDIFVVICLGLSNGFRLYSD